MQQSVKGGQECQYFYTRLKKQLSKEIGDDKEKLLDYKMECQQRADSETINVTMSTIAILISILAIICSSFELTMYAQILLAVVLIIYVIGIPVALISKNEKRKKYSKILFVINEIHKELE